MREIKVRGYAVEKLCAPSQWVEGFGVTKINYTDGTSTVHIYTNSGVFEVFEESVGQYTGLRDKNDREIFEGAIVEENDLLSVCCFIDEVAAFAFVPTEIYPKKDFLTIFETYSLDTFFKNDVPSVYVEVVGTVYEHPHLLEVQDERD